MDTEFSGKTALVTGGAMGIGGAVAELLAARGASIAIVDRAEKEAAALAKAITDKGGKAIAVMADVSKAADVEAAVARAVSAFGGLDVVSNNAGIQRYGTAESTSEAEWDEVMNVNLKSIYLVCHAAIPHLKARKGAIVNMASVQGFATQKGVFAYTTGKAAVVGLTRSLALDLAAFGVRANAVAPGSVDTPMLRWAIGLDNNPEALMKTVHAMHPLGRIAKPSEVAECVAFLASARASFVTGITLICDGGLLLPISGAPADSDGAKS
jgi:NAD(P)-dependent dehydrogenase (short-subunit alcohol dehydrogenase family)